MEPVCAKYALGFSNSMKEYHIKGYMFVNSRKEKCFSADIESKFILKN